MGRGIKKPPYTRGFTDRHGHTRHYFRRPGFKQIPLPGLPWTPEFMAAYEAAMKGESAPLFEMGASRTAPGTINAAIVGYYSSAAFLSHKPSTQTSYRLILESFRAEHGQRMVADLERKHVERLISKKAGTPVAANSLLRMLRTLMQFAIGRGMRRDDPTAAIKSIKIKTDGFHTWTQEEIAAFENRHPVGTRARLAFALLYYTAQRRSDVVNMGKQHIKNEFLFVQQQKTGKKLQIPVLPELRAILDATPNDHLTFIVSDSNKPLTAKNFGAWFREVCDRAGLEQCSAHGLRKAFATRLADMGCTQHEIMAITGHTTGKEVDRYTVMANQQRLAIMAMDKITKRTKIGNPA